MSKNFSQFAVIGLGRFGSAVAKKLFALGKDVMVVDNDEDKINEIENEVTHAIVADASEPNVLKSIGIGNFDCVIICTGGDFEASVMATIICKELGVQHIVAKAHSDIHKQVLSKIGADMVIFPEKDMGIKLATMLVNPTMLDTMDINDSFQLAEIKTPKAWAESKLNELNLRRKYGLNVIFIKCQDGTVIVTPGPETILHAEDGLVICGSKHDIARVVQDI